VHHASATPTLCRQKHMLHPFRLGRCEQPIHAARVITVAVAQAVDVLLLMQNLSHTKGITEPSLSGHTAVICSVPGGY
jgi:hypothetical protein